jgi:RimJ/RimL family protein N-acetyltransferase
MKLKKAHFSDSVAIWEILQQAIEQRRLDGSEQWQKGYPNEQSVYEDITKGYGYVLTENDVTIAYAAIIFDIEPAYNDIIGKWLTNGDYVVVHRVATSNAVKGRGVATELFRLIEDLAVEHQVFSIKIDTNFDNVPMLKILKRLDYSYCGEVFFHGAARQAFEKVLRKDVK